MSSLTLDLPAGSLTAAATDSPEPRTAEGILVPYGVPGRTSAGLLKVARGALRQVDGAPVIGLYGHRQPGAEPRSVSRLVASADRPEGLWGRLRIAETPDGDLLLAELRAGIRDGLSVELSDLAVDGDTVTAARLDAIAHVPLPAYDSARVHTLAAAQNTPPNGDPVTDTAPAAAPAAFDTAALVAALREAFPAGPPAAEPAPALQASLTGLPTPGVPATPDAPAGGVRRLAELQAAQAAGNTSPELMAALHDVTNTSLDLFQGPAGAIGTELWTGAEYQRRFVPLMNYATLTSWQFTGWRWVNKPRVQDWAGDKTEIPTNPVSVEPVVGEAERCAGGWDVDRKFRDLPTPGFWEGFYRAQTESYRELSDQRAAAAIVAAARDITVDANVPTGYAGVNVAQADILRAAALGGAILEDTPNVRRPADYVVMNTGDWLGLMDLTNLDLPAFLSLLGVQPGSFLRSDLVPAGRVILGVKPAMTFRELGGGAPIRVEALDVARGGIDSAVYGYTATSLDRPGGVIAVPLVPAG